ncbi:hypothetical protein [Demequina lutea]|uniref:Uncharacterized protein n=1 Tax=Demequina lutea TaxID=431489 RepID=A0A7Y9Z9H1_9MICO|nr:hypothetical protein [Demequina lutea]NYI40730.1 hypothetical protein [Demequina lutea]
MAARTPRSSATPEPVQPPEVEAPAAAAAAPVVPASPSPSVLERLRRNRMGAMLGGLVVAIAVALLLSVLVPNSNLLLALTLLGLAEAFAVGFTVRYLSGCRGLRHQVTAFVLAAIGVHVLATTGLVNQKFGDLSGILSSVLSGAKGIGGGLGWDDAVMSALATPAVSTGAILCGLVAAIIAGWGVRESGYVHK